MDQDRRRATVRAATRRYREKRRLNGTPDRRAIADALLKTVLSRRADSLFAALEALTDAGFDADESRCAIAEVVARANVDTTARQ